MGGMTRQDPHHEPTCPLCGQPGDTHDQAACDDKTAHWQPTGIITSNDPDPASLGIRTDTTVIGQDWAGPQEPFSEADWLRALRRMQDAAILRRHG